VAVRLLAGPIPTRYPGAAKDLVITVTPIMWIPGSGGMMGQSFVSGWDDVPIGIMTLDGVFCDRCNAFLGFAGWWPAKQLVVQQAWEYQSGVLEGELQYDPITFAPERAEPPPVTPSPIRYQPYVKLADRRLMFEPVYLPATSFMAEVNGVLIPEGPPNPFSPNTRGRVHPGRSDTEVFVAESTFGPSVRCIFYDTVTRQWSSPLYTIGMSCYGLVYATDFGVLVSVHTWAEDPTLEGKSSQVRVWSLEIDPTTMTPVEVIEGPARVGQVVAYRVRVTGDHEDPAVDELVEWAIEGIGTLLEPQSRTDAEGYASTQVQYGVYEAGDSTIEASLSC
jgi:hypothetical protein